MDGGRAARTTTTETQAFPPRSLEPLLVPIPFPSDFLGSKNLTPGDEEYEGCFQPCAKKRRLATNQVQFLEKSFEVENKLEPERKSELAKKLGLQPRQVAIWFQNRRARYKTKQLEKDYGALKTKFDELRADYDGLVKDGDGLRQQLASLKEKLIEREKAKESTVLGSAMNGKQDASSVKSDVVDSGSPRLTGEFCLETANSVSHVFEPDNYSDGFSQDDEDEDPFNQRLRIFPTLELGSADMGTTHLRVLARSSSLRRRTSFGSGLTDLFGDDVGNRSNLISCDIASRRRRRRRSRE